MKGERSPARRRAKARIAEAHEGTGPSRRRLKHDRDRGRAGLSSRRRGGAHDGGPGKLGAQGCKGRPVLGRDRPGDDGDQRKPVLSEHAEIRREGDAGAVGDRVSVQRHDRFDERARPCRRVRIGGEQPDLERARAGRPRPAGLGRRRRVGRAAEGARDERENGQGDGDPAHEGLRYVLLAISRNIRRTRTGGFPTLFGSGPDVPRPSARRK